MRELVGPEIVARYAIVDHDSEGATTTSRWARSTGTPILLQRDYVEADVRIITGFVEPHFFAGFSGGPKAVCPGLAATETILEAHHPRRIADAGATFVTRHGQPGARLRPGRGGTGSAAPLARCGHQPGPSGHRRLRRPPRRGARCRLRVRRGRRRSQQVAAPFDVVVSTNGGHPLDRNLYQAVKGMAAAERIVRAGGIIVMAAACGDGIPGDGAFAERPRRARTADDLVDAAGGPELDRWQAQVLGRVLRRAQVWLFSEGMTDEMTADALLVPVHDLSTVVAEPWPRSGERARVAVLPEGPLTVATVAPTSLPGRAHSSATSP